MLYWDYYNLKAVIQSNWLAIFVTSPLIVWLRSIELVVTLFIFSVLNVSVKTESADFGVAKSGLFYLDLYSSNTFTEYNPQLLPTNLTLYDNKYNSRFVHYSFKRWKSCPRIRSVGDVALVPWAALLAGNTKSSTHISTSSYNSFILFIKMCTCERWRDLINNTHYGNLACCFRCVQQNEITYFSALFSIILSVRVKSILC